MSEDHRHRNVERVVNASSESVVSDAQNQPTASGDEDDEVLKPDYSSLAKMYKKGGRTPRFLQRIAEVLPPRWANWTVRMFTAVLLIGSFLTIIWIGPLALVVMVLGLQLVCFHEIISIGHVVYRSHDLPWFRVLSWYFLFTSNYFLFGEHMIGRFRLLLAKEDLLQSLVTHHQFISFTLYSIGIVWFVLSLVKKHYVKQFYLFGWTHVALLILVSSSHMHIQNIFNGLIWFLLPVSLVICNDIMAYVFGFFFGKTPLIRLSPKKTWEGFIGGGLSTVLFGLVICALLIPHDHFVCPLDWDDAKEALTTSCVRNPVFEPVRVAVPWFPSRHFTWYPIFWHSLVISVYTSVVGPFGGFFASGFKRAFKIKDFGDLFPGHGGVIDRFDCQFITGSFMFLYYNSFVRVSSAAYLLSQIYVLPPTEQLNFFQILAEGLTQRGLLPGTVPQLISQLIEKANSTAP